MSPFSVAHDALRSLRRSPAIPLVAVGLLALGIGANTAVFTVVRAALLRPLPYHEPDRLVAIWQDLLERDVRGYPSAPADLVDYRRVTAFEDVAGVVAFDGSLVQADGSGARARLAAATTNLFDLLGVAAARGRVFEADDGVPIPATDAATPPPADVALLSWSAWQSLFGEDPGVLGSIVHTGNGPVTVVGVLPPDFRLRLASARFDEAIDLFLPLRVDWESAPRQAWFLTTVARLREDATLAEARTQLDAVREWQWSTFPAYAASGSVYRIEPLQEDLTREVKPGLTALAGAVALVLLVTCVNVGALLLVRAASRTRELAVRASLGGDRRRLSTHLFLESLLLAVAGGALGLLVAWLGTGALLRLAPEEIPTVGSLGIDAGVAGFASALSIAAALLFGTLPALRASKPQLASTLRDRVPGEQPRLGRLLGALVVAQVATCTILLVAAGLLGRSFSRIQEVALGFEPAGIFTFRTDLPVARYPEPAQVTARVAELRERLAALPGVVAVSASNGPPFVAGFGEGPYGGDRELADGDEGDLRQAYYRGVLPGYFETLKTPLVAGRLFDARDQEQARDVVVVDRLLAQRSFPSGDAVGKRLYVKARTPPVWVEVIGVVEPQRLERAFGEEQEAIFFLSSWFEDRNPSWILRTTGDPRTLEALARAAVRSLDPEIAFSQPMPLAELVERASAPQRFTLVVLGLFAAAALLLALVGLYGVLAFAVRARRREIGVRLAIGASPRRILGAVLGRGLALVGLGLSAGLLAASLVTRALASQLVETSPRDGATFASVAAAFLVAAAAACLLPARRAARIDPVRSLREE